jgi:hypothetical protein
VAAIGRTPEEARERAIAEVVADPDFAEAHEDRRAIAASDLLDGHLTIMTTDRALLGRAVLLLSGGHANATTWCDEFFGPDSGPALEPSPYAYDRLEGGGADRTDTFASEAPPTRMRPDVAPVSFWAFMCPDDAGEGYGRTRAEAVESLRRVSSAGYDGDDGPEARAEMTAQRLAKARAFEVRADSAEAARIAFAYIRGVNSAEADGEIAEWLPEGFRVATTGAVSSLPPAPAELPEPLRGGDADNCEDWTCIRDSAERVFADFAEVAELPERFVAAREHVTRLFLSMERGELVTRSEVEDVMVMAERLARDVSKLAIDGVCSISATSPRSSWRSWTPWPSTAASRRGRKRRRPSSSAGVSGKHGCPCPPRERRGRTRAPTCSSS